MDARSMYMGKSMTTGLLKSTRRAFPQQGAGARGPSPWQVGESKVLVLHLPLPCALPGRRYIPPGQPQSSPPILHSRPTPGVHMAPPDDVKPTLAHAPHPGPTRPLQSTQSSTASPRAHPSSPHDTAAPRPVAAPPPYTGPSHAAPLGVGPPYPPPPVRQSLGPPPGRIAAPHRQPLPDPAEAR